VVKDNTTVQMALDIEDVVDGGVSGKKPLG
jgi:hypothetical protein